MTGRACQQREPDPFFVRYPECTLGYKPEQAAMWKAKPGMSDLPVDLFARP
jgi:hypothetical protein